MASIQQWAVTMTPQDKRFYQELGQRIAGFRKAQNLTQQQLAEILGISQQTMAHYEVGRLRVSVAMLSPLARALAVSVEELIGESSIAHRGKRGPASKLQQQIEQIGMMPRAKQKFITEMLEALIKQQQSASG
jgi:transcriptional regulator with XRE-family HTH domain